MTNYRSNWLDTDLDAFRDLVRGFLAKEVVPNLGRFNEQHHVDRELWIRAGELGLLCLSIPEEYGGGGGSFAHEAVFIEEQARVGDSAWGAGVHSGIVAHYLAAYGTEEQKRTWLPRMASGEVIGAIAMTEPGTGSDLQNVQTKAVRDGDEYVVSGSKTFITCGGQADLIVVVAKTAAEDGGRDRISLILVEADRPGFRRGRVLDKLGRVGQDTSELFFDEVRVPVANLLGEVPGVGFVQMMQQLPQERLIIAVGSVAVLESALRETIDYTKQRKAFGQSVFEFQNTRFKLADIAAKAHVARVFVDSCVERHLRGELDATTAAMAKLWLTEQSFAALDECIQLHGGYGYMTEYPIARAWADERVQRIYGGTNEIMRELVARSL